MWGYNDELFLTSSISVFLTSNVSVWGYEDELFLTSSIYMWSCEAELLSTFSISMWGFEDELPKFEINRNSRSYDESW